VSEATTKDPFQLKHFSENVPVWETSLLQLANSVWCYGLSARISLKLRAPFCFPDHHFVFSLFCALALSRRIEPKHQEVSGEILALVEKLSKPDCPFKWKHLGASRSLPQHQLGSWDGLSREADLLSP